MSLERQILFWGATLAVFAALLWLLADILLPFVAGMALAYLLDPLTRQVERTGVGRAASALIVTAFIILVIVLLAVLIGPIIGAQLFAFIEDVPRYLERLLSLISEPNREWLNQLFGSDAADPKKSIGTLITQGAGWLATALGSIWTGGRALLSVLSLLVITPVVAIYLLIDWDRLIRTVDGWIPLPHRETVRGLAREMNAAIAGFVRGQALVCTILGLFYAVGLSLAGLKFGVLIGLFAGLMSFVPFVGAAAGFVVATGVALAQFWPNWISILLVMAVFGVGQFIEGNFLSPKLVGSRIGLHPVWLMFALLAFGYLFGFVGLLVAVPTSAAIGVLLRFALRRYMASPLYTGGGAG